MRIFARYLLFQVPGWLLVGLVLTVVRAWFELPLWIVVLVVSALMAKDLALFPLVRRAYSTDGSSLVGTNRLMSQRGVAEEPIDPSGYVRLGNELWQAEAASPEVPIAAGTPVQVRAVRGLTLLVEATEPETTRS